ncbi:MAG TPA: biotin transporter BioY, partial [Dehalococcoidales bacterium]|nr:biotin transporter BioY [Dehalococcoidales bacterium]
RNVFGLMLLANTALVFGLGLVQLYFWLNVVGQGSFSVYNVLAMGFFPFIVGDLIKVTAAAAVAWAISPKK